LFGGDSLYEVLAAFAANRDREFSAEALADEVRRTVRQTRKEIRKLEAVGAVERVGKAGKREYFAPAQSEIAATLLSLPELLVRRLGEYRRPS
jgi:hypothetical protein